GDRFTAGAHHARLARGCQCVPIRRTGRNSPSPSSTRSYRATICGTRL
ncbi:MAG: hypothetical protein AVDCRST_MAG93-3094, partial [uncultured Chloroflexia bacterium]